MVRLVLRRLLIALMVISLIGGVMLPSPVSAHAPGSSASSVSAGPDPCDRMMANAQDRDQSPSSIPCGSMPCKGFGLDCLQMCLGSCTLIAVPNEPAGLPSMLLPQVGYWPADQVQTG